MMEPPENQDYPAERAGGQAIPGGDELKELVYGVFTLTAHGFQKLNIIATSVTTFVPVLSATTDIGWA